MFTLPMVLVCVGALALGFVGGLAVGRRDRSRRGRRRPARRRVSNDRRPIVR